LKRQSDLIFDAEKRWALIPNNKPKRKKTVIWSLMLKSVEHLIKAIKTEDGYQVIWSLMLKSVEHIYMAFLNLAHLQVIWSLMLKSVEHSISSKQQKHIRFVIWSLMLKSVEHSHNCHSIRLCYWWFDLWCWKALST